MYANNPQAFMNGFLSGSRNIFLTSSIGIAESMDFPTLLY